MFKLFRNISRAGNFSAEDVVATSPVISFASYNEPTQGHLAMTADPRQGFMISNCTLCVPAYQKMWAELVAQAFLHAWLAQRHMPCLFVSPATRLRLAITSMAAQFPMC